MENGVATRCKATRPPHTDGVLCAKVSKYTERTYHPERILTPLKRSGAKGSGQFTPVTWDEALSDIAQRLQAIAARAPEAILPLQLRGHHGPGAGRAWTGASSTAWALRCSTAPSARPAGGEALVQTLGGKVGMKVEFFAESQLILIWGSNSIGSNLHFWRYAQQAKRNGAKLVCIDPARAKPPTSATNTSPCAPAPTPPWRWR